MNHNDREHIREGWGAGGVGDGLNIDESSVLAERESGRRVRKGYAIHLSIICSSSGGEQTMAVTGGDRGCLPNGILFTT
jgi:hypothetical protein